LVWVLFYYVDVSGAGVGCVAGLWRSLVSIKTMMIKITAIAMAAAISSVLSWLIAEVVCVAVAVGVAVAVEVAVDVGDGVAVDWDPELELLDEVVPSGISLCTSTVWLSMLLDG
jgi:hypothetical protein